MVTVSTYKLEEQHKYSFHNIDQLNALSLPTHHIGAHHSQSMFYRYMFLQQENFSCREKANFMSGESLHRANLKYFVILKWRLSTDRKFMIKRLQSDKASLKNGKT